MSGQNDSPTSATSSTPDDLSGAARLLLHIKGNNIQYLVGLLIAHQMGILDSLYTYGAGMC